MLVIELAEAVPAEAIRRVGALVRSLSDGFREERPGAYDVHVAADRLGITDVDPDDRFRPFFVSVMGAGIGDQEIFEAEHADEAELEPFIGFKPTHAVDVIAFCNSAIDHHVAALLTAALMDIVGGVAHVELREDQRQVVAGLPGVTAMTSGPIPRVFGTAEFLRRWVAQPGAVRPSAGLTGSG